MTAPRCHARSRLGRGVGLWLFCCAFFRLGQVTLLLRSRGYQWVALWAEDPQISRKDAVTGRDFRRAQRYARQIERASRCYPEQIRCLHRSLVLHHWLRREGFPSLLRIGVSKVGTALLAHAWVELDGQVVNDSAAAVRAFTPLADTTRHAASANGHVS